MYPPARRDHDNTKPPHGSARSHDPLRRLLLASALALVPCHRVGAQPAAGVRRVGWLSLGGERSVAHLYPALEQGMRELGWERGKNVDYRLMHAEGNADRLE